MGRGEFFRWGLKMFTEESKKAIQHYTSLTKLTGGVEESQGGEKWTKVLLLEQLSARPRLLFFARRPCYLSLVAGEIQAFSGLCPQDHRIISWQEHTNSFVCMVCGREYNKKGELTESGNPGKMFSLPVKVAEGMVFVNFEP